MEIFLGQDRSTDDDLLARYRDGDFGGFDRFYQRNHLIIFRYLTARLGNRADVEEAFQETFLKIHKAILSYDPSQKALPWVFTIARNVAIDLVKRRRRHSSDEVDRLQVPSTTERALLAREELQGMLSRLSEDERTLLERRLIDDEEFDSIARDLTTTTANARQKVSRLLRKLRGSEA